MTRDTVDGRNPAPADMVNIPFFMRFFRSQVVSQISSINSRAYRLVWIGENRVGWILKGYGRSCKNTVVDIGVDCILETSGFRFQVLRFSSKGSNLNLMITTQLISTCFFVKDFFMEVFVGSFDWQRRPKELFDGGSAD